MTVVTCEQMAALREVPDDPLRKLAATGLVPAEAAAIVRAEREFAGLSEYESKVEWGELTLDQIAEGCGLTTPLNKGQRDRLASLLRSRHWYLQRRRIDGKSRSVWTPPPF